MCLVITPGFHILQLKTQYYLVVEYNRVLDKVVVPTQADCTQRIQLKVKLRRRRLKSIRKLNLSMCHHDRNAFPTTGQASENRIVMQILKYNFYITLTFMDLRTVLEHILQSDNFTL